MCLLRKPCLNPIRTKKTKILTTAQNKSRIQINHTITTCSNPPARRVGDDLRNEPAELLAPLFIRLTPLEISGNEVTLSTVLSPTSLLLLTADSPATTDPPVTSVLAPPSPVTKVNVFTAFTGGSS
jgi:hypothetical protein